ncbi:Uncharacterised protein [Escherichia coli]|uniref:Phage protein n=1 Tax=Escherichia coli TaxID=562 RepID=A0A376LPS5_ECOLX|nr:Uncharacterised protein [Escherichia coli]
MKLKTVEINGKQYAEIDTAGLPVYVHDDGKEIGFDAPLATKKITELNGEAKNHRLAKEAAEEKLAKVCRYRRPEEGDRGTGNAVKNRPEKAARCGTG